MDFQWFPHPHPIDPSRPMDFRNTSGDTSVPPMVERRSSHFEAPHRGFYPVAILGGKTMMKQPGFQTKHCIYI